MVFTIHCDYCAVTIKFIYNKREMLKYCINNNYKDGLICDECAKSKAFERYRENRFLTL